MAGGASPPPGGGAERICVTRWCATGTALRRPLTRSGSSPTATEQGRPSAPLCSRVCSASVQPVCGPTSAQRTTTPSAAAGLSSHTSVYRSSSISSVVGLIPTRGSRARPADSPGSGSGSG